MSPVDPGAPSIGGDVPWGVLTVARDGRIVNANERVVVWTGHDFDALVCGLRFADLLTPASLVVHETHYLPLLAAQGYANEVAFELRTRDGRCFPVLAGALMRTIGSGGATTTLTHLTLFDATETRRHERELMQARHTAEQASDALVVLNKALFREKEALRVTLRSIVDAVVTLDADGLITSLNPTAEHLTGVALADALGSPIHVLGKLLDPVTQERVDLHASVPQPGLANRSSVLLRRHDGTVRHIAWTAAPILDELGTTRGTVVVCHDVTEQQAVLRQLEFDATHDHLTGIYNRREFERRVAMAQKADPHATPVHAVCYIDLDQFKVVNDTSGHMAGDQLLVQIAELLQAGMRASDTFARLGGDEFGVLLANCPFPAALQFADNLRQRVAAYRFTWKGRVYTVTVSIGVSVLQASASARGDPLTDADIACNAAKEGGRNRVHGLEPDDSRLASRRGEMGWVGRIQRALDDDRFELHFQPIVGVGARSDASRHGELLLRMRDDDGRLLTPGAFISAAERYNQMEPIDRWVLRKSFEWLDGCPDLQVSINLSGQSFGNPKFLSFVVGLFSTHRVAPRRVCFEITETAAIADLAAALRFIRTLRPMGVGFSLDDFGSGLSSFAYLKTLPVDFLKIDGGFVKAMTTDPVNRAIVESIHRVARLCGLETVAEWVEDEVTLAALESIGVDYAQGLGIGRPIPLAEVRVDAGQAARRMTSA